MNKIIRLVSLLFAAAMVVSASGCSSVDRDYGVSSEISADELSLSTTQNNTARIMSSDRIMPNYVDISQYDEENYADIYLGKKFKMDIVYENCEFEVPSSYKKMTRNKWEIIEGSEYSADSLILACESNDVVFVNESGKRITAVFYNPSNSSVKLKKCNIVKFKIGSGEDGTACGSFSVNGVTNDSAITDIIEKLGSPSHFYALSESHYYLDYFISGDDRRNGITVYVDPANDSVISVEFALYK